MNCECLDFNEKELAAHYQKAGVVNPEVRPDFIGLDLATGEGTIHLTYTIHGDNKPYNTQKGKVCNVIAKYCPFCGKPTSRSTT